MEYQEKEQFIQALIDRTNEGSLNWSMIGTDIVCETVGVKFVLYEIPSGYKALRILNKDVTIFKLASNYSPLVYTLYSAAKFRAEKLSEETLIEVVDMINKKIKPVKVDRLEVDREI